MADKQYQDGAGKEVDDCSLDIIAGRLIFALSRSLPQA